MNIEDFQSAWEKEGADSKPLNPVLEKLQRAHQPLDRIRFNMRKELICQSIAIVTMGFWPVFFRFNYEFSIFYYSIFALLVVITVYYFARFYQFFKDIHNYSASSKDSLYELYYEIRLNMEAYKSYSFLLVPFAIVAAMLIVFNSKMQKNPGMPLMDSSDWVKYPLVVVVMVAFIIWATHRWVDHFYGKHAKQIRKLLDELKETD